MKILVFAGPSLPSDLQSVAGDIVYLPPAGQCDVLSSIHKHSPDVVVLADTMIWPSMSVLHKELLWALAKGVRVIGTGAGGALRASELTHCGMKGHGWVYERTESGMLEDDSEVFCVWEKTGDSYNRTTEPLVNIRATLEKREVQDAMGEQDSSVFLMVSERMYFKHRTPVAIEQGLMKADIPPPRAAALIDIFFQGYRDIQEQDLAETIAKLADPEFLPSPMTPDTIPFQFDDQGAIFRMLYDHDRIVEQDGQKLRLFEICNFMSTRHPQMEAVAYNSFNRELVLVLAETVGVVATREELEVVTERFRRINDLTQEMPLENWLQENDLSREDFDVLMKEETLIKKMQETFLTGQMFQKNTRPVLNHLRLSGEYPAWKQRAFRREEIVKENEEQLKRDYLSEDFLALIMERHRSDPLPWKDRVHPAADSIGIGAKELKMELLKDKIHKEALLSKIEEALY